MENSGGIDRPYLGPSSFGETESDRFFGRADEIRELTSLVIARRVVLLYAQSGAGKTSLIKAGLIPELRRQEEIGVLPITRVSGAPDAPGQNPFMASALSYLFPGDSGSGANLRKCLRLRSLLRDGGLRDGGSGTPHLMILDQFEEIFTSYPERSAQRREFFEKLSKCLKVFPQLTLLISMREDYLANILSYSNFFPDQLRTRMRLERLKYENARAAVRGPAAMKGKPFAPGVAEELVNNLRRIQASGRVDPVGDGALLGEYVEPVQLQIVCWRLWEKVRDKAGDTITTADVAQYANVDDVLQNFYESSLDTARIASHIGKRRLRLWVNKHLITPAHTRGLVYRGLRDAAGLPNTAVDSLEKSYLIRDARGGGEWYELTHDRLVEPILESNRKNGMFVAKRWRWAGLSAAIALLLYCAALMFSRSGNQDLANDVLHAVAEAGKEGSPNSPSMESLPALENLRQLLEKLTTYRNQGPPWSLRFGLYNGNNLLPAAYHAYYEAFRTMLLDQTQRALHDDLSSLSAGPPGTSVSESAYSQVYPTLKAYLITTSNPEKSSVDFLSPVLLNRWSAGRNLDGSSLALAKTQFDYYASDLRVKNPYPNQADADAVQNARLFLAQSASFQRVYVAMLTQANQKSPTLNFNRQFAGSAQVVVNSRDVPGAFTQTGWQFMAKSLGNLGSYTSEDWVLGSTTAPGNADATILRQQIQDQYRSDFVAAWRAYLNGASVPPYAGLADAAQKLQTLASNQSPLLAMLCLAAQNVTVGDPAIAKAFQPVTAVLPSPCEAGYVGPANRDYMVALTALQGSVQEHVPSKEIPTAELADRVRVAESAARKLSATFQPDGEGHVDATVTRLLLAPIENLGLTALSAAALNANGAAFCAQLAPILRLYPFNSAAPAEVTGAQLNSIFRKPDGALWTWYNSTLQTLLPKVGSRYVPKASASVRWLRPDFVDFFNQAATLSDTLYPGNSTDPQFTYTLRAPAADSSSGFTLVIDGQALSYSGGAAQQTKQFAWQAGGQHGATLRLPGDLLLQRSQFVWAVFRILATADSAAAAGSDQILTWIPRVGGGNQALTVYGSPVNITLRVSMPALLQKGAFASAGCVPNVANP